MKRRLFLNPSDREFIEVQAIPYELTFSREDQPYLFTYYDPYEFKIKVWIAKYNGMWIAFNAEVGLRICEDQPTLAKVLKEARARIERAGKIRTYLEIIKQQLSFSERVAQNCSVRT